MHHILRRGKKTGIAIAGGIVIVVGVILIPYPGPGWLIVFTGFAVLATEFEFAGKALAWLKSKYEMWVEWLRRQHVSVRILSLAFTGFVILLTAWFLNTFGLLNGFFDLGLDWLESPFLQLIK